MPPYFIAWILSKTTILGSARASLAQFRKILIDLLAFPKALMVICGFGIN
jgi:hypothetical protein